MAKKIENINWGCHGIPDRCLMIHGKRMNICARCTGGTIGNILAFIFTILHLIPNPYILLGLGGIMFMDRSLQQFFNIPSNNKRRLVTGLLGGFGVGGLIWSFMFFLIHLIYKKFLLLI